MHWQLTGTSTQFIASQTFQQYSGLLYPCRAPVQFPYVYSISNPYIITAIQQILQQRRAIAEQLPSASPGIFSTSSPCSPSHHLMNPYVSQLFLHLHLDGLLLA